MIDRLRRFRARLWRDTDLWADQLRRVLVCSWAGHSWNPKMYGRLCRRCAIFQRT